MDTPSPIRRSLLLAGAHALAAPLLAACASTPPPAMRMQQVRADAPFAMPAIDVPGFGGGVLSVETDVLYQWRTLVPTLERRLTPIEGLYVSKIRVGEAQFVCRIKGDKELPVREVTLDDVRVDALKGAPVTTENVIGFRNRGA